MRRLFRHAHPDTVFLRTPCHTEQQVGDEDEHENNAVLDIGEEAQLLQHGRFLVKNVTFPVVEPVQHDRLVLLTHLFQFRVHLEWRVDDRR